MSVEHFQIGFKIKCKGFQNNLLLCSNIFRTKPIACAACLDICMLTWLPQLLALAQLVASFFASIMDTYLFFWAFYL